ncbi:hypothetical protein HK101_001416 [Irineochytrium annulatum]|nr:hypothetical protein HK101_001416 [Irineochytrium annulatum]
MLLETTPLVLQFQKAALAADVMMVSASCAMLARKVGWALHKPYIPSPCATLLIFYSYDDPAACDTAILYCVVLYAAVKLVVYLRYLLNLGLLLPYGAVEALMFIYRIHNDSFYSQWLNLSFFLPLMGMGVNISEGGKGVSERIKRMCRRSLVCSILSFVSSFTNILTVVIFDSGYWTFVCLTGCMGDCTVQAILLSWVTAFSSEEAESTKCDSSTAQPNGKATMSGSRRASTAVGYTGTKSVRDRSSIVKSMIEASCEVDIEESPEDVPDVPELPNRLASVRTGEVKSLLADAGKRQSWHEQESS